MRRAAKLYIVIPCYNEEEIIELTISEVSNKIDNLINAQLIDKESSILFIDDGSTDSTWKIISSSAINNNKIKCIKLSTNVGTQKGLMAGLLTARNYADLVITMDADLQHDINSLDEFLRQYHNGFDIVYGVRNNRKTDSLFRKFTATWFYAIMNILGANTIVNHSEFRLMSKNVLDALSNYSEVNLYLRGIISTLGFKNTIVLFDVKERGAGESKFNLISLSQLALDGITSFSIKPLRLITVMGIIIFLVSIVMIAWNISDYFRGISIPGWASLSCSIWFLGGLILLSIGIVGEYIGKIYTEVKHRPRYIIDKKIL